MPGPAPPPPAAPPPEAFIRPVDRPSILALRPGFWLVISFGAVALLFAVLSSGVARPASGAVLWDFAMGSGFAALALAAMQFALSGRIKWLTNPFGTDVVHVFHRILSWGVVALMLLHFGVLFVWYQPALSEWSPLIARWEPTSGRLALWLGVTVVWVGFASWSRRIRPMVQIANPWRVVGNKQEHDGVHTLTLRPEGNGLRPWRPGRFAWLSVGHSPHTLREHPFTISRAPEGGPQITFSIKPLEDESARLRKTPVGGLAYVDGPFGTFTVDRQSGAGGFVMIAGGVGIMPLMANLQALRARRDPRRVILLYANKRLEDAPFREDLNVIARDLDLKIVHVPQAAPGGWVGEVGMIDADVLARHLPLESRAWPHMLCGPAPMPKAVIKALRRMGVRKRHITQEPFESV